MLALVNAEDAENVIEALKEAGAAHVILTTVA
jgi:nitrogen regulatory protein PII